MENNEIRIVLHEGLGVSTLYKSRKGGRKSFRGHGPVRREVYVCRNVLLVNVDAVRDGGLEGVTENVSHYIGHILGKRRSKGSFAY